MRLWGVAEGCAPAIFTAVTPTTHGPAAPRLGILAALAAVYIIWGSTYLAIRFAVETLPPFLMAAVRFLVAGGILYGWRRARGFPRPTGSQWRAATVVGALMLLGGNGGVVWAEQWIESGTAALIVATVPLWMVLLDWLRPGGRMPRPLVWAGISVGLVGVGVLFGAPEAAAEHGSRYTAGWIVLVLASVSWAIGSLYSRTAVLPAPLLATGMQMLAGGALLLVMAVVTGELRALDPAAFSTRSLLALGYLIVFGALVGYSAYVWLLRVTTPAVASTYAYVNPVVAVLLGWWLAAEALTPRIMAASAVIVGGVALITRAARPPRTAPAR
jgi:drug/metabolite transporter (DMT)-like permease